MKVRKEDKDNFDEVGKARWSEAKRRRSGRTTGKKKYMKGRTEDLPRWPLLRKLANLNGYQEFAGPAGALPDELIGGLWTVLPRQPVLKVPKRFGWEFYSPSHSRD